MIILAHGVEQPTTGDPGSVFFPILERLCQKFANHTHDGVNSYKVSPSAITSASVLVQTSDWNNVGLGLYEATVNLPPNFDYDEVLIECREEITKEPIFCDVIRITDTQCKLVVTADDLAIRVYFK